MAKAPVKTAPVLTLTTAPAPAITLDPNALDAAKVTALRDMYLATVMGQQPPLPEELRTGSKLSDEFIWKFVLEYRAQYPTADDNALHIGVVKRMFAEAQKPADPITVNDTAPLPQSSQVVVDALNRDTAFVDFCRSAMDARTIVKSVPQNMIIRLLSDFATIGNETWTLGRTAAFECPTLDALPEPGSKESKTDKTQVRPASGFDIEWKVVNGKEQMVSRFREIVRRFPEGERIETELRLCDDAIERKTGPYKDNSKEFIVGEQERLAGELSDLTSWLRDAVKIIRQMQAVNKMVKLSCHLITFENTIADGTGTVIQLATGPNKMKVRETREGGADWPFSLVEFMKLRPEIAEAKGGTLGELRASPEPAAQRAPQAPGSNAAAPEAAVPALTLPTFAIVAERFGQFMSNDGLVVALRQRLNDKDESKSDAILKGLADTYIAINALLQSDAHYVERAEKLLGFSTGTLAAMLEPVKDKPAAAPTAPVAKVM